MVSLFKMPLGDAVLTAVLGYAVVFLGLLFLMLVISAMGKLMSKKKPVPAAQPLPEERQATAPGSAGEVKLYDTDPKDAAMIMAIVADSLGKPLNELRFISIKEVRDE